jgi:hypothetical protein
LPLLFNFTLEYALRKVQESKIGLILDGRHQLLAYAYEVNLLGDNTDTVKRNVEIVIDSSREIGVEINEEKTRYMLQVKIMT